jgi:hypothetical protein
VSAAAVGAGDNAAAAAAADSARSGSAGPLPVKLTEPVEITSLAGANLTFAWWPGSTPSVKAVTGASGSAAAVVVEAVPCGVRLPCFRFSTTQGVSYEVVHGNSSSREQPGTASLSLDRQVR